jgi:hypothetical protein
VFTLDSGAPANALFVNNEGNVGLGTSTPGGPPNARLHIVDPSPEILFDVTQGGGQLWDLYADDTEMGIADESAGTIPFSVEAGAPTDSLIVKSNGDVGLGTFSPDGNFHVVRDANDFVLPFVVQNTSAINFSGFRLQIAANSWIDFNNSGGNFRINANQIPGAEFEVRPNGNAFISGVLTQGSDINSKQDIVAIAHEDVLEKVMKLPISEWSYKESPDARHIGPMAQDFYQLFSLGETDKGITSIDTGGVALAAIQAVKREKDQQLAQLMFEKNNEIDALRSDFEQLRSEQEERILQLEMAISELLEKQSGDIRVGSTH